MAGIIAKYLGWSYSRTLNVFSNKTIQSCLLKGERIIHYSTQSQFINKSRKQDIQNKKKRYLKRIHSLDQDHDLEMPGK
jgi:hypothetical protein